MQELASKRNIRTANATLKGGREEECVINSLDASYVLFKKVLQLFMTEVVAEWSAGVEVKQATADEEITYLSETLIQINYKTSLQAKK